MPSAIRRLPLITLSTAAAPQSGTWELLDDAETVSFILNAATTTPFIQVQAAVTASSGSAFVALLRPIDSTNPTPMTVSSSGVYTIWPAHFSQLKFVSTGLITVAGGIPIIGVKSVSV